MVQKISYGFTYRKRKSKTDSLHVNKLQKIPQKIFCVFRTTKKRSRILGNTTSEKMRLFTL